MLLLLLLLLPARTSLLGFPQPESSNAAKAEVFEEEVAFGCVLPAVAIVVWGGAGSLGVLHASAVPQASTFDKPDESGIDCFGALCRTALDNLAAEEDKLNADVSRGAGAACDGATGGPPDKSNKSPLGGAPAGFGAEKSEFEVEERKSPNPPGELTDPVFANGFEAGGSKNEPPEPNPAEFAPVELLVLGMPEKLDIGLEGCALKLSPLNASVRSLDADCWCVKGSGLWGKPNDSARLCEACLGGCGCAAG